MNEQVIADLCRGIQITGWSYQLWLPVFSSLIQMDQPRWSFSGATAHGPLSSYLPSISLSSSSSQVSQPFLSSAFKSFGKGHHDLSSYQKGKKRGRKEIDLVLKKKTSTLLTALQPHEHQKHCVVERARPLLNFLRSTKEEALPCPRLNYHN